MIQKVFVNLHQENQLEVGATLKILLRVMNPVKVIAKKKSYRLILASDGKYNVEQYIKVGGKYGWCKRYNYGAYEPKALDMFSQL